MSRIYNIILCLMEIGNQSTAVRGLLNGNQSNARREMRKSVYDRDGS